MNIDRHGYSMSGATPDAAAHYDQAVHEFNLYRGDPIATIDRAIAAAPPFTMAHVFKAYLLALATEPAAMADAAGLVATAHGLSGDDRERSHLAALEPLLRGDWTAAALALDLHSARYPRDLVALQVGHVVDFYRANARSLRDRIARVLPHWSDSTPGHGVVLGMYAFGLEECGDYGKAETAGLRAIDDEPLDCWAHHAVAHVMEMQGRAEDGINWAATRESYWARDDNFFKVHNWWHRALCHLDLRQTAEVLRLYDGPIRGTRSVVALDLVDASALLWRLTLIGHDVVDRWIEVAECWDRHADGRLYPFNDWHAVMAYLGAGRESDVERVIKALERTATGPGETARWAGAVALPLVRGFRAFSRKDYAGCVEGLYTARHIVNQFGGSHAQRDVIDWTLTEAAVRGKHRALSAALAHERLALKPHSVMNRLLLKRARAGSAAVTP